MTKADARLMSELIASEKETRVPIEVRLLINRAAQRLAQLIADNEALLRQGDDHA